MVVLGEKRSSLRILLGNFACLAATCNNLESVLMKSLVAKYCSFISSAISAVVFVTSLSSKLISDEFSYT